MAPNAILGLLATLSLFSGCLGETSAEVDVPVTEAPTNAAPATAAETLAGPAPLPECPESHSNNNGGTWTQIGDHYIVSPYGGMLVVYYEESNGCNGMQTEQEWSHNPDTKVVAVPYPVAPAGPVSGKA